MVASTPSVPGVTVSACSVPCAWYVPRYDWQDAHQLAAKDLSRQRIEHRFSIVALLQPEQRILPELRHNQPFLLGDKDHHRTQRQRGGIGPVTN